MNLNLPFKSNQLHMRVCVVEMEKIDIVIITAGILELHRISAKKLSKLDIKILESKRKYLGSNEIPWCSCG